MITAALAIDGDSQLISDLVTAARGRWIICRVNLTMRARIPGGSARLYDTYTLPAIVDGDCKTAIEHIQKLLRQARITNEEAVKATAQARQIAELTKR
jgi:thioredoxin-like negative regulator of GroEL